MLLWYTPSLEFIEQEIIKDFIEWRFTLGVVLIYFGIISWSHKSFLIENIDHRFFLIDEDITSCRLTFNVVINKTNANTLRLQLDVLISALIHSYNRTMSHKSLTIIWTQLLWLLLKMNYKCSNTNIST